MLRKRGWKSASVWFEQSLQLQVTEKPNVAQYYQTAVQNSQLMDKTNCWSKQTLQ